VQAATWRCGQVFEDFLDILGFLGLNLGRIQRAAPPAAWVRLAPLAGSLTAPVAPRRGPLPFSTDCRSCPHPGRGCHRYPHFVAVKAGSPLVAARLDLSEL